MRSCLLISKRVPKTCTCLCICLLLFVCGAACYIWCKAALWVIDHPQACEKVPQGIQIASTRSIPQPVLLDFAPSIYLRVHLSACQMSIYLRVHLPALSIFLVLSFYLCVHLPACPFICVSIYLRVHIPALSIFLVLSFYLCVHLPACPFKIGRAHV